MEIATAQPRGSKSDVVNEAHDGAVAPSLRTPPPLPLPLPRRRRTPPPPPLSAEHHRLLRRVRLPPPVPGLASLPLPHPLPNPPPLLQWRILSFLRLHRPLFHPSLLRSLASSIPSSSSSSSSPHHPTFWASSAARHLLDELPQQGAIFDRFYDPPQWLLEASPNSTPLLHWLPLSGRSSRSTKKPFLDEPNSPNSVPEQAEDAPSSPDSSALPPRPPVHLFAERLLDAQNRVLGAGTTKEALRAAKEIEQLCSDTGDPVFVLSFIQPWEANDDIRMVLLSNLSLRDSLSSAKEPALLLCSLILPNFLAHPRPISSLLLSPTLDLCKRHPTAAVEALLFPTILRKQGLSFILCDILTRIIKECMHRAHVAAFCQRLLCGEEKDRRIVCMAQHKVYISHELVWEEPLFMLFYNILNLDVALTPDSAERLVLVLDEMAPKFQKSSKFGNFMLSFVTKCGRAAKLHKSLLERAAAMTDTVVTKAILSKLHGW
uniref:Fanconi Anaemia group E protein C-terminal domain-containing protein n=1 Tax=Ananas comosus var. bracteatus TaxID=296719 RepID=A0A6V7QQB7_ANACO